MSDDITFYDDIEAYCGALSYRAGDLVELHVSSKTETFAVRVQRWGAQMVDVYQADGLAAEFVAPPSDADSHGCRWPVTTHIPIGDDWVSGFHLITLTADDAPAGRNVAHAGFVVRSGSTKQRALLVLGTNTWNAYNTWGGASLYTGAHQVSFRRPWPRGLLSRPEVERDDRKSRPVRFGEEADADGEIFQAYRFAHGYTSAIGSTGWFTHERRFVEWAEGAGYTFDYAVSSDLDHDPNALSGYDLVLGVGHDEYWTAAARDLVDAHIGSGGGYVSLSGNTMFWQVRLVDPIGDSGLDHMVCHKYSGHLNDTTVHSGSGGEVEQLSGLWCEPSLDRPEWTTLGAGSVFGLYHRFGTATARGAGGFSVFRPHHWMLAGTGLGYGDILGPDHGVVGYETVGCPITLDEFQLPIVRPVPGMPTEHEIVGLALSSNLGVGDYPKSIAALSDQGDLEFLAERYYGATTEENLAKVRHGNAVMVACRPQGPAGGEVVTIGTTDWVFGLADDHRVDRVTANIMDHFLH